MVTRGGGTSKQGDGKGDREVEGDPRVPGHRPNTPPQVTEPVGEQGAAVGSHV